ERGIIENFLRVCRAIAKSKSTSGSLSGEAGGVGQAPELDPANLAEGGKKFRSTEISGSDPAEDNASAACFRRGNGGAHARAARGRFGPEGHASREGSAAGISDQDAQVLLPALAGKEVVGAERVGDAEAVRDERPHAHLPGRQQLEESCHVSLFRPAHKPVRVVHSSFLVLGIVATGTVRAR